MLKRLAVCAVSLTLLAVGLAAPPAHAELFNPRQTWLRNSTAGLFLRFGAERLRDTPISERGFVGLACGAAMTGTRPVVDFMFADFVLDG